MEKKQLIVKVCGINQNKNMVKINELPIDMLGLNFYLGSKRYIGNTSIIINPNIKRVGVFVDATIPELKQYHIECQLDYVQLHGDASPDFCLEAQEFVKVIKAFGVDEDFDFDEVMPYSNCDLLIFDTKTPEHGGSGRKFAWEKLNEYQGDVPFLLAGGIGPDDVDEILAVTHPQFIGVDINSKFEFVPGRKNIPLVEAFVNKIKN